MNTNIGETGKNEKGAALITALLFLLALTALGMAALVTSGTDRMIARNDYMAKQALNAADAGVQEAMAMLDAGIISPAPTGVSTWKSNAIKGSVGLASYSTIVYYKLEEADLDSQHYKGTLDGEMVKYNTGFQYSSTNISDPYGSYVYTIRSVGSIPTGGGVSTATLVADITENMLNVFAPSGLYSGGCITQTGAAATIAGGTMPEYVSPCVGTFANPPTGDAPITGTGTYNPDDPAAGGGYINMTGGVSGGGKPFIGMTIPQLRALAQAQGTYYDPPDEPTWPIGGYDTETDPKIVFIDGDYTITSNKQGYGLLIVNGKFTTAGTFDWKGLIYVTGDFEASAGTCNIQGGIMAMGNSITSITGTANISYNGDILAKLSQDAFRHKILNWRRQYN